MLSRQKAQEKKYEDLKQSSEQELEEQKAITKHLAEECNCKIEDIKTVLYQTSIPKTACIFGTGSHVYKTQPRSVHFSCRGNKNPTEYELDMIKKTMYSQLTDYFYDSDFGEFSSKDVFGDEGEINKLYTLTVYPMEETITAGPVGECIHQQLNIYNQDLD